MFRTFQVMLDNAGNGSVDLSPYIESMEWDIYQLSIQTGKATAACTCEVRHNGFFLCNSLQGWKDTAVGPPDIVVQPGDMLSVNWINGAAKDEATVGVWYNENPTGTTYSTAH